jgi:hypothetical protein
VEQEAEELKVARKEPPGWGGQEVEALRSQKKSLKGWRTQLGREAEAQKRLQRKSLRVRREAEALRVTFTGQEAKALTAGEVGIEERG